jgi:hypothetical protein
LRHPTGEPLHDQHPHEHQPAREHGREHLAAVGVQATRGDGALPQDRELTAMIARIVGSAARVRFVARTALRFSSK